MLRQIVIALIAIVLSAIVWWIGPLIAIGIYKPLLPATIRLVMVCLLLAWGFWPILAFLLRKLFRPPRLPAAGRTRQDRISVRFHDACRTLRHVGLTSRRTLWQRFLYRFTSHHLHDRPWYLILGPAHAGKSSLVAASGQQILLSKHYGLPMTNDIGPTKDCNIWLTDQAVYIDTAGGWLQQDGMDATALSAWEKLLKLIRRNRRHPALDGLVLCLDAHWLAQASAIERKVLTDAMRARVLEIAARFRSDLPVYLLLNRLDTLPGAAALLSSIPQKTLAQGIGMTLAFDDHDAALLKDIDQRYQELEARLQQHVLSAADTPHASHDQMPQNILLGLESVSQLRPLLLDMVEQLFPQALLGFSGKLRSIWLGSSASDTAGDAAEAAPFGICYQQPLQLAISERGIAARRSRGGWSRNLRRIAACTAVVVALGGLSGFLLFHYQSDRSYIASATENLAESRRLAQDALAAPADGVSPVLLATEQLRYMEPLMATSKEEHAYQLSDPYLQQRKMRSAIDQTYRQHLQKALWPEVQRYVSQTLASEVDGQSKDLYETLKIYLMLAQPEQRNAETIRDWFGRRWQKLAPAGSTAADKSYFEDHIYRLLSASDSPLAPLTVNSDLLHRARILAATLPLASRVLAAVEALPLPADVQGVSLTTIAGPDVLLALRRGSDATVSDVAIPGLYTKAGFQNVLLPHLDDVAGVVQHESAWVLDGVQTGSQSAAMESSAKTLSDTAYRLYLQTYAEKWHVFLQDIRPRRVTSLDDAAQLAAQFSEAGSPLDKLIQLASRETTLEAANRDSYSFDKGKSSFEKKKATLLGTISGAPSAVNSLSRQLVDQRFDRLRQLVAEPTGQNGQSSVAWLQALASLGNQLNALSSALRIGQIMPQADIFTRLRAEAEQQPAPLKNILAELIQIGSTQNIQQSRQQITSSASGLDSAICTRTIAGRYPFNRQANTEIGMDDFNKVFQPSGSLQSFFDKNLVDYVDTNSRPWRARKNSDNTIVVNDSTIRSFENAALIRNMFFNGGSKVSFSMTIKPLALDPSILEATLDIDGQVLQYSHGPQQAMRIEWPGAKGGVYARLSLRLLDNQVKTMNFEGPWALFKLLDSSQQQEVAANQRSFSMETSHGKFRFEIRPASNDFPLWSAALPAFRCPT